MKLAKFALTPPIAAMSVAIFAALGAVAVPAPEDGVLYVKPVLEVGVASTGADWSHALTNLQEAVDTLARRVSEGLIPTGVVWVAEGTYTQAAGLDVTGRVSVVAVGAKDRTTIVVNGQRVCLRDADSRVSGFTLTRGSQTAGVKMFGDTYLENCVLTNFNGKMDFSDLSVSAGGGVYMKDGGTVRDCLITKCQVHMVAAGIYMVNSGLVERCEVTGCSIWGGGSSGCVALMNGGVLRNSLIHDNSFPYNLGATGVSLAGKARMEGCTVVNNKHTLSGGAAPGVTVGSQAAVTDCIIWGNAIPGGTKNCTISSGGAVTYTCTTPLVGGAGNISSEPSFLDAAARDYRIKFCGAVDNGTNLDWMLVDGATDLTGTQPRIINGTVDMGCYEATKAALSCSFAVSSDGLPNSSVCTFAGRVQGDDLTGLVHMWTVRNDAGAIVKEDSGGTGHESLIVTLDAGVYTVTYQVRNGVGDESEPCTIKDCVTVLASRVYANASGTSVRPYAAADTGATNILDAVAMLAPGGTLWVEDGTYPFASTLYMDKEMTVRSTSGNRTAVILQGSPGTDYPIVSLSDDKALMADMTVGSFDTSNSKASRIVIMSKGQVTNCVLRNTKGVLFGHGIGVSMSGGTVAGCDIINNVAYGSGATGVKGAGVQMTGGDLLNCVITNNACTAGYTVGICGSGLTMTGGKARGCLIAGNSSVCGAGVWVSGGVIENCTIYGNTNKNDGVTSYNTGVANTYCQEGGLHLLGTGVARNCIIWENFQIKGAEKVLTVTNLAAAATAEFRHCCSIPCANLNGVGNVLDRGPGMTAPEKGDFQLVASSPCRNAGENQDWMKTVFDLEGRPRILFRRVDIGAHESPIPNGLMILVR